MEYAGGMQNRSSKPKHPRDLNQLARAIVNEVVGQEEPELPPGVLTTPDGKNAAAVLLGRLGGRKGGPARAAKLSDKRRSQIARKAAQARWSKREPKP